MRLALLPGLDGTGLLFDPLIDVLPRELDAKVVSYPWNCGPSIDHYVEAASRVLSGGGPWLILAESFSGPIAFRLIAEHSRLNVAGVVFCASFLSPPRPMLLNLLSLAPLGMVLAWRQPDWALRRFCLGQHAEPHTVDLLRRALAESGPTALSTRLRLLAAIEPPSGRISIPCLYIRPTADRLVPESCVQGFVERCDDLKSVYIPGPHFILQSEPVLCAQAIATFAGPFGGSDVTASRTGLQS